ncbi:MAG: hypothetical protein ACK412_04100 [Chloroherpetonaceae bacterium]
MMVSILAPISLLAQPKPTIEQYAECLSESLMKELTDTTLPIIFMPEKNTGFKRELDLRLQSALLEKGFKIRESPLEHAQELRYEIQSASVSVEERSGQFVRTVSLNVFVKRLLNRELNSAKSITAQKQDTLSQSDLERLNDTRYPETTIAPRRTWFDKAFVPTLTTLSLGVIVYLFFSVRSN